MRKLYLILLVLPLMLGYSVVEKNSGSKKSENISTSTDVETDSIPQKNKKSVVTADLKRLMPPIPASFSSSDSARFIANWTLGMKFYKSNCANCHGIFGKGKDSIPNFSKEQMDDYKSAHLAGDKLNHAVMARMTEDELSAVFLFLTNIRRK
jgi:cytochrome c553